MFNIELNQLLLVHPPLGGLKTKKKAEKCPSTIYKVFIFYAFVEKYKFHESYLNVFSALSLVPSIVPDTL